MGDETIGTRAYGKRFARSRWYECSVCGQVKMQNETVVPTPPHPQAGLRVCLTGAHCFDELDYATHERISPPRISPTEDLP